MKKVEGRFCQEKKSTSELRRAARREARNRVIAFLDNADSFAWSAEDMPGIDRSIADRTP